MEYFSIKQHSTSGETPKKSNHTRYILQTQIPYYHLRRQDLPYDKTNTHTYFTTPDYLRKFTRERVDSSLGNNSPPYRDINAYSDKKRKVITNYMRYMEEKVGPNDIAKGSLMKHYILLLAYQTNSPIYFKLNFF